MKILIEDYHYSPQDLPPLDGLARTELSGGLVKFSDVGYYYDGEAREAIFILPKVFLKDSKAFGKYTPESLLQETVKEERQTKDEAPLLFKISVQIYQAIALFCERHPKNKITSHRKLAGVIGQRRDGETTLLDLILALIRFEKEHQSLFTYIATIAHSGRHKIHWTKTIRTTSPVLQDGKPYYLQCKTKEKAINYDEELICLFYSTLDYLK